MSVRVVIADDHASARAALAELLESRGHGWQCCGQAENGRQAVLKTVDLRPDIVILDLVMPGMNGLSAAQEIGKALPAVPIVLFTLHKIPILELEAKKAGVCRVVAKPDVEMLCHVVEELTTGSCQNPGKDRNNSRTGFPTPATGQSSAAGQTSANHR